MNRIEAVVKDARPFLDWVGAWAEALPVLDLAKTVVEPDTAAVLAVDLTRGFCYKGPLSSPRVANIVPPSVLLFKRAHALGVRHFIFTKDTHEEHAVEFESFAAHCVRGSRESEPVPELAELPFFDQVIVMPKNSISSNIATGLPDWLAEHPEVTTFIVIGDCTDFCVYQLAMYLRLRANEEQRAADRVIVPADCVDTFDVPVEVARELGIFPHHGDLLHLIFLYHMALNGVQVVAHAA